ncbi:CBS domain-containing protein [Secundilactobacillus kimchicus]|uniref:Acetoin utilization probable CBS domain protein n=1 Tax=Secundilactobacillus kimchicus JCM 15530 TaxID=1302272 RepID=A0A0R1HVP2_9LACO|nr:CBS domain-containing protein [Secundilactobacillus kimchicus]KRK47924.1 acetoin utilization probable CBS domain protein [Secundilactobacillus kimchicus JCM 15530]
MTVADYMTDKVITVNPDTLVSVAVSMMKDNQIHRLPVIETGKLVGLVTAGIVEAASPSAATSLSIYEVNYIFNKMTVGEIMEKEVQTISYDAILEDGIYKMRQHDIGVLPVMDGEQVVGILTTNDILDAFLDITDYQQKDTVVQIVIEQDSTGIIFKIGQLMADNDLNIQTLMVTRHMGEIVIEMHVDPSDQISVRAVLESAGFTVR